MRRESDAFARHEREQRTRWLALTPAERLAWLERAKCFVRQAHEARAPRSPAPKAGS